MQSLIKQTIMIMLLNTRSLPFDNFAKIELVVNHATGKSVSVFKSTRVMFFKIFPGNILQ